MVGGGGFGVGVVGVVVAGRSGSVTACAARAVSLCIAVVISFEVGMCVCYGGAKER